MEVGGCAAKTGLILVGSWLLYSHSKPPPSSSPGFRVYLDLMKPTVLRFLNMISSHKSLTKGRLFGVKVGSGFRVQCSGLRVQGWGLLCRV